MPESAVVAGSPTAPAPSRVEGFSLAFFSSVMGTCGVALMWRETERLLGAAAFWSYLPFAIAAGVYALLIGMLAMKARRFPASLREDWEDPVRLNYFATATISLMLFGTFMVPVNRDIATALWATGTALHLVLTFVALRRWIDVEHLPLHGLNPTWFMPVVGNMLVPIAGMPLGFVEPSWFCFAIGFFFWPILLALIVNRLFFHGPMPPSAQPTLFILLSPPAVGFLAYLPFAGGLDAFAQFLYYVTVFTLLLLLTMLPRLLRTRFTAAWWSFSFPTTAAAVAILQHAQLTGSAVERAIAHGFALFTTVLVAYLAWRTVAAVRSGTLFRQEA